MADKTADQIYNGPALASYSAGLFVVLLANLSASQRTPLLDIALMCGVISFPSFVSIWKITDDKAGLSEKRELWLDAAMVAMSLVGYASILLPIFSANAVAGTAFLATSIFGFLMWKRLTRREAVAQELAEEPHEGP